MTNITEQSSSMNTSIGSSQVDNSDDMDTLRVKTYVKELLKSRIFLGRYLERRLTDERIGYRDVVLLSAAEVELKRDLIEVRHRLRSTLPYIHWIGITDAELIGYPSNICLWTEIDNEPFGLFWFQIRNIKFREQEIIVNLKCLRHISDAFLEVEPALMGSPKKISKGVPKTSSLPENNTEILAETYKEIICNLKTAFSVKNVKEFVTFLVALVIAVFTGSTALINFTGNFVLALMREMSLLIKNSTPIFLGFLDFLSKIVGGFYILVAMFFKPSNPAPPNRRTVSYSADNYRRTSNHYDGCFD